MKSFLARAAAGAMAAVLLACGGLGGGGGADPQVTAAIEAIEGTRLEAPPDALPPISLDGAAAPTADLGNGVQVLQIAPVGEGRRALQAAVVFDRPMVPLSDLDSMTQSPPLSCTPAAGRQRWAGTSTAVVVPDGGAFPRATRFTCTVPAGTAALDGVALEKPLSWTFDTPRPRATASTPADGGEGIDPKAPIVLRFDQPVDPATVAPRVSVTDGSGRKAKIDVGAGDGEEQVRIVAALALDTAYTLRVEPGVVGREGPLPSTEAFTSTFRTYGPLVVKEREPTGDGVDPATAVRVSFSNAVTGTSLVPKLTIEPKPEGWNPTAADWPSRSWWYGANLAPRTKYTVRLDAGIEDEHGQPLAKPFEWTFTTADFRPRIDAPGGLKLYAANNPLDLPFRHLNAEGLELKMARFDPAGLGSPSEWAKAVRTSVTVGAVVPVAKDKPANHLELDAADLRPFLADGHGWVATALSAANLKDGNGNPIVTAGLMVVTDLGGTIKVSPDATDVWVTSLSSGAPVEGVEVQVFQGRKPVGTARTGADGLARVAGERGPGWNRWSAEVWALLRRGPDTALVSSQWADGISSYNFGIYGSYDLTGRSVVAHAFADRGVYRPGDPAFARAMFRVQDSGGLRVPAGEVAWRLVDPDGETAASGAGRLDDRGSIAVETRIPADGRLGDWHVSFEARGEGWTETASAVLMARAYRPPAFRVHVSAPDAATAGDEVTAAADARYLFGAPLRKGSVQWRAWTEPRWFEPEGWDGWSFGPEHRWWDPADGDEGVRLLGDETEALADGRSAFTRTVEPGSKRPSALWMEAEVTDVDRQAIANRAQTLVHPAAFYVGVQAAERLPRAGSPARVRVAAVQPDGTALAGQAVEVKVVRRTWDSVREKGMDGQWRWVDTAVDADVASETATTRGDPVEVAFTPSEPGYHVVTVTARDAAGREVVAEEGVYVVGKGYVGWGRSDDARMELVPDRKQYAPGDKARILVKAPYEGLRALVTAEREGVLWKQVVTLEGTAATVEVPIAPTWRPNVYVSVVAVQGAGPQDAPDKGRPQVYVGMTELAVDATPEHLEVEVRPAAEVYRPRDEVEVTVAVKRAGQAVSGAGVLLYAVDEAVLSLTGYETPDAFGTFYARHGHSVVTGDGRIATLDRAPYLRKGALRGGGGGMAETGPEVRSRFVTTVTWQPDLETSADGTLVARFALPDNLTTFRLMAVADDGATGFGSAEREVRVTRPLIVRPALPRLLREGDAAFAGVVVHNDAPKARWVDVSAEVSGPLELEGAPVTVQVPAGGSLEVPFRLKALEIGEAKLTFRGVAGSDRDAVEVVLPIGRDVPVEVTATSGTVEGRVVERIARPDGARGGFGGLEVDVASTALLGAGEGLDYLVDYPHGCLEQRTSRALASLVALRVRERAGIDVPEQALRANVEGVLRELRSFRAGQGALAYWPGSEWPSVLGTAYAVELAGAAKEAGFAVDEELLEANVSFLRDAVAGRVRDPWGDPLVRIAAQAYVAKALAVAGQGDAGLESRLFAQRRDLSVMGMASLLRALIETGGADARTAELEQMIAARTTIEAASASVKENQTGRWAALWASDDLSTASALEALVAGGRKHPLAPKYALHLASSRRTGHWQNTRATAAALAALADYADGYETDADAVRAVVALAGRELLAAPVEVPGSASVELPMNDVQNGELVLASEGGLLYYQARLSYAPTVPVPRDEGFTVTRTMELLDGGGASGEVAAGATLRVTLTVVTPVVRHLVAVVDPLPAGLEAVDSSLSTASRAPVDELGEEGLGYAEPDEREELPEYGGSPAFDHVEVRDDRVLLYADYLPPGIHTYRYVVRATTPGTFDHPPASAEEMYEPENFGRTGGGTLVVAAARPVAER